MEQHSSMGLCVYEWFIAPPLPLSQFQVHVSLFQVHIHMFIYTHICTQASATGQKSREGTPSRHEGDNLSVDSGDILSSTPPGSPATQRKRRYPALALSPAQRAQQDPGPISGSHTHIGEAADGSFFSEKLYRNIAERCHINGL